jgi:RNA polymerase sigma-70 factor, ECF subfamily
MSDAFLDLLNAHQGIIHRIARAYALRPADRQDLVQDIVFQLWRAYPAYRRESSATTWVYRIALNTAITVLRRRTRRPVFERLERETEPRGEASAAPPEPTQAAALHAAIRELNGVDRALIMCYLEDISYKRIAQILGISEANVGTRLTRLRARLQARLAPLE